MAAAPAKPSSARSSDVLGALAGIDFSAEGGSSSGGKIIASAARARIEQKKAESQRQLEKDLENFTLRASSPPTAPLGGARTLGAASQSSSETATDLLQQVTQKWVRERCDQAMARLAAQSRGAGAHNPKNKARQLSRKQRMRKERASNRGETYDARQGRKVMHRKRKERMQRARNIY